MNNEHQLIPNALNIINDKHQLCNTEYPSMPLKFNISSNLNQKLSICTQTDSIQQQIGIVLQKVYLTKHNFHTIRYR
jgi:hypothetical protein